ERAKRWLSAALCTPRARSRHRRAAGASEQPARASLDRPIAGRERQRLARHLAGLRAVAVGRVELGGRDPEQRVVRVDPARTLERRGGLAVAPGGPRGLAPLEERDARGVRLRGGPARRGRAAGRRAPGRDRAARRAERDQRRERERPQCSRFLSHSLILEPTRTRVLPQATAFGGTSRAVIARWTASGQRSSVASPVR